MRTTRSYDPQSGITTVKDITLISTSGVTANEYNELPEKSNDAYNTLRATQSISESIQALTNAQMYTQGQKSEDMLKLMLSILELNNTVSNGNITADTIMVNNGEDSVSLNDAIAGILQSLSTLTTKVDSLINTTDSGSGSESSNITSTE